MFSSNTTQVSDGGYQISRSLRFNSADSAYLNRTPASAGNRRTWTFSAWVKRSALSGGNYPQLMSADGGTFGSKIGYFADDTFWVDVGQGATYTRLTSTAVYRDVSAWYHVVVAQDTTQATDTNRVKVYINGSQITLSGTYPTQNFDGSINNNSAQNIGRETSASYYFNGYMTEVNFIDGQALTPSSFGETNAQTGVWQPKAYSGSYGTNGFYLNFSDNSNTTAATLGKDYSGNGNNWTPNNFSVTAGAGNDSLVDSPTSYGVDTGVGGTVRGNYATLNPLQNGMTNAPRNGNLEIAGSADIYRSLFGTFGVSSGKWYFEVVITSGSGVTNVAWSSNTDIYQYAGSASTSYGYELENGNKINNGGTSAYGSALTTNDVFMCAVDMDNLKLFFGKNGTWFASSNPVTGTSPAYTFAAGTYFFQMRPYTGSSSVVTTHFGQRAFAYTAPSGFKALCTQNLPTPTIGATTATQAGKYYNAVVYNGANQTPQNITTVGFQPDFVWIKWRANSYYHNLFDVIRGVNNVLSSNVTVAEGTRPGTLTSFNSDGFSLGNDSTYSGVNIDATSYVAWNWKANGAGVTNTSGSITSTVSANTTSGFSVVTYTGNGTIVAANGTVGHGLGVVPSMIIIKRRDSTGFWYVATKDGGTATSPTYSLFTRGSSGLNQTGAAFTTGQSYASSGYITSSTFNLYWLNAAVTAGDSYDINYNTGTYVAYCFAEVAGYSKFGSYTGNGSADGPFVFTGMRPAYLMIKRTSSSGTSWNIYDTTRIPSNVSDDMLFADLAIAELANETTLALDILSNGFKLRTTGTSVNGSGDTYIYMAFASAPFKYSLAR